MRMYDIIAAKRDGRELSPEEIRFFIQGYTRGDIPDYQAAALLMAVFLRGMTRRETADLTLEMAASGDRVDLSSIPGVKVDKHSTGGVGDKTTLIVAPAAAACGVPIAKMSGRGLGHTGGTVDKLESIPGFETQIGRERFLELVREVGVSVVGQSGNLAPADKKLYALRDVTATVESMPLIASSIMSKKIAAGADAIVLDVKTGSGAFMSRLEDAVALAREMVQVGESVGRKTVAVVTDMDRPLGSAVGNSLEVAEAVEVLRGAGPDDLREVSLELAANMLFLAGKGRPEECRRLAKEAVDSGRALEKFIRMVEAQGGSGDYIRNPDLFPKAPICREVKAPRDGYILSMNAREIGMASVVLGAGREKKEDSIDYSAGIFLYAKTGDFVRKGETVARLLTSRRDLAGEGEVRFLKALAFGEAPPPRRPLLFARVTAEGVEEL